MIEKLDFIKRDYVETSEALDIIFEKIAVLSLKLNEVVGNVNSIESILSDFGPRPQKFAEYDWTPVNPK